MGEEKLCIDFFHYSAVGDDAANPLFLKDFLHPRLLRGKVHVLLGNNIVYVEEIAESSINITASDMF